MNVESENKNLLQRVRDIKKMTTIMKYVDVALESSDCEEGLLQKNNQETVGRKLSIKKED